MNNKEIKAKLNLLSSNIEIPDVKNKVLERIENIKPQEASAEVRSPKKKWIIPSISFAAAAVIAGVSVGVYFGTRTAPLHNIALSEEMNEEEKEAFKEETLMASSLSSSYLTSNSSLYSHIKFRNSEDSSSSETESVSSFKEFIGSLKSYFSMVDILFNPPEITFDENGLVFISNSEEHVLNYTQTKVSDTEYKIDGEMKIGDNTSLIASGLRYLDEENNHHLDFSLELNDLMIKTERKLNENDLTTISFYMNGEKIKSSTYEINEGSEVLSSTLELDYATLSFSYSEKVISGNYTSKGEHEFKLGFILKNTDKGYKLTINGYELPFYL